MKKTIFSIIAVCSFAAAFSQTVTPRTGTGANNDNTFRAMTVKYKLVTDGTGNDTAKINLNGYQNIVRIDTLKDSVNINLTPVTNCYLGDRLAVIVKNGASGSKVKFVGSNVQGASGIGSISITASKLAVVEFVFNGYTWLETNRVVQ